MTTEPVAAIPRMPDGAAYVAPGNDLPLHTARAAVTDAIRIACASGRRGLLADFHGWNGGENPSLALRIDSIFEWASAAEASPGFVVALVIPLAFVDPGRIGFIIGRRLSFNFDVFGDVGDAITWMDAELAAMPPRGDD
ncbi:hypothetical protein DWG18_12065 [Lysobacter sp. TY2-98]|uniref:hypothetical protein n=1 Tax=Lysobacter sp. TY2-98 TaxID=2290922 RepID=UPI000E205A6C|nr:hypothetical protein [Lysobacter sp. TY2-98]AXK72939.1 hypothetical protein DWG18_12065 [Lysobacter sp. TY2-98]